MGGIWGANPTQWGGHWAASQSMGAYWGQVGHYGVSQYRVSPNTGVYSFPPKFLANINITIIQVVCKTFPQLSASKLNHTAPSLLSQYINKVVIKCLVGPINAITWLNRTRQDIRDQSWVQSPVKGHLSQYRAIPNTGFFPFPENPGIERDYRISKLKLELTYCLLQ